MTSQCKQPDPFPEYPAEPFADDTPAAVDDREPRVKCLRCGGTGWVRKARKRPFADQWPCPACDGAGTRPG